MFTKQRTVYKITITDEYNFVVTAPVGDFLQAEMRIQEELKSVPIPECEDKAFMLESFHADETMIVQHGDTGNFSQVIKISSHFIKLTK